MGQLGAPGIFLSESRAIFWHLRQGSNAHLANMCAEADVSRAESQQQSDSGWCARVELWGVSRIRWEGMTEKMWEEEQRREVSGLIDPSSREISRSVPQVQRGRERGTDWGGTTMRAWTLARLESSGARGWPLATPKARDDIDRKT